MFTSSATFKIKIDPRPVDPSVVILFSHVKVYKWEIKTESKR